MPDNNNVFIENPKTIKFTSITDNSIKIEINGQEFELEGIGNEYLYHLIRKNSKPLKLTK
jgi:hypothetical protein